jgi:glycosyltransferase involved in cell wall biosynthesis
MPALGSAPAEEYSRAPIRVAAFTRYGREAASTRQRLLQYLPALNAAGIEVQFEPLLDDDYVRGLAQGRSVSRRRILRSYLARFRSIIAARKSDIIWVYAELLPYLPGWIEMLALGRRAAIVYDFDDAFFHNYDSSSNSLVRALLGRKLEPLMRSAAACTCGNDYLEAYASRFCARTMILPTVVDTQLYKARPSAATGAPVVIGWIGSPSTWPYLKPVLPILADLVRDRNVKIRIIGAGASATAEDRHGFEFVEWAEEREVADVQSMDIGIMPLPDEVWARGKSGYKLIQYLACAVPAVASPVGVNSEIVTHGRTGFIASTAEEWRRALCTLIDDADLRARLGAAGRERVQRDYSLQSQAPRLVHLLRSLTRG